MTKKQHELYLRFASLSSGFHINEVDDSLHNAVMFANELAELEEADDRIAESDVSFNEDNYWRWDMPSGTWTVITKITSPMSHAEWMRGEWEGASFTEWIRAEVERVNA